MLIFFPPETIVLSLKWFFLRFIHIFRNQSKKDVFFRRNCSNIKSKFMQLFLFQAIYCSLHFYWGLIRHKRNYILLIQCCLKAFKLGMCILIILFLKFKPHCINNKMCVKNFNCGTFYARACVICTPLHSHL
jgi:hypothetical protein